MSINFVKKPRSDRPGAIEVRWFVDGQKFRKSFPSDEQASQFIRDQKVVARAGGSPFEVIEAQRVAAGTGIPLPVLAKAGLEQIRASNSIGMDVAMTFRQAAQRVHDAAVKSGARPRTLKGYLDTYKVLNLAWGDRVAAAIAEPEVEKWLAHLPDRNGRPGKATASTKDNYLRHIRMALRQAGVGDPLRNIVVPGADTGEVEYFEVSEVRTMLASCPENARGFLAVAVFAGIRPENLEQLPESAISVVDRRIRIPAEVAKDGNTHLLESGRDGVLPDVLWKWLRTFPYRQVRWKPLQRRLAKRVGRWIQDGLRHTAATYYHALHGTTKTARLLTHSGESLVRKHYAGVVESIAAKQFYDTVPAIIKFDEPERTNWPSDDRLAELLRKYPATHVAEQLGVSDSAIAQRCKVRGIEKPGRGEWTKIEFQKAHSS